MDQGFRSEQMKLKLFHALAGAVASRSDLRELFEEVTPILRSVVKHEFSQLLLYDDETGRLKNRAAYFPKGKGFIHEGLVVPLENTPAGLVFETKQPLLITRPDETRTPCDVVDRLLAEGVRSGCCVPLVFREKCLGVLSVGSSREGAFAASDQELLSAVASFLALAIDDMQNHERLDLSQTELAQRHARLQLLLEINKALVTKLDIREVFQEISACLRRLTRHLYSQIVLYDPHTQQLVIRAVDFPGGKGLIHEGLAVPPETPAGMTFARVQALLVTELTRDRFPSDVTDEMLAEGVRSVCLTPLVSHKRVLGVLSIGRGEGGAFTTADLDILVAVANQAAIAVENALAVEQIAELNRRLTTENVYLEEEIRDIKEFTNIVGESPVLKRVLKQVEIAAPTDATVLLMGETGTGKELLARAIHDLSTRRDAAFIKLNCSAIPTGLLESELFGHEKGAFTGALTEKIGRLELAHQGTLFMDEVGDLPLELQPKLLRVLQDGEFERLGGTKTIYTDVRVVAATNRDLAEMIADSDFREDLYYRLNVFPITLPSLRERADDIPVLIRFFVEKYARQMKKRITTIPDSVTRTLASWPWPGNVRELQNFLQRAVILSQGPALEIATALEIAPDDREMASKRAKTADSTLRAAEKEHILNVLRETKGVIGTPQGASAKLGLKRTTLYAKMRKLGITRRDFMS